MRELIGFYKGIQRLANIAMALLMIALLAPVPGASAETQYVSDELVISLREGASDSSKALGYLRSNTPLEVLGEEGDYLQVRTKDGQEGWVSKKYVTPDLPDSVVIGKLRQEVDSLKKKLADQEKAGGKSAAELKEAKRAYEEKISELKSTVKETGAEVSEAETELAQLKKKYDTLVENSGDVVALIAERDALKAEKDKLYSETEMLTHENDRLKRRETMWWFLAGAGVLLAGWIIGKASRQKRFY